MGRDLLKHTEVAVSHQHGMDPILDDTKVDDNQQVDDTNLEHNEIELSKEGFSEEEKNLLESRVLINFNQKCSHIFLKHFQDLF